VRSSSFLEPSGAAATQDLRIQKNPLVSGRKCHLCHTVRSLVPIWGQEKLNRLRSAQTKAYGRKNDAPGRFTFGAGTLRSAGAGLGSRVRGYRPYISDAATTIIGPSDMTHRSRHCVENADRGNPNASITVVDGCVEGLMPGFARKPQRAASS
jgi:hypothetical protein